MLAHSSVVDTVERAKAVAVSRLEDISGEFIDETPDLLTESWLRERSGYQAAALLDSSTIVAEDAEGERFAISVGVRIHGHVLVREAEAPFEWWMGSEKDPGVVVCWGSYGPSLDRAIDAL